MPPCRSALPLGSVLIALSAGGECATFCVTDRQGFDAALQQSWQNAEDDAIRLVIGTYGPPTQPGAFNVAELGHALLIEGGYQSPEDGAPCSVRTDDPTLTAFDGNATGTLLRIDSFPGSGDVTLRNLTLRNGLAAGLTSALELLGAGGNVLTIENAIVSANRGIVFQFNGQPYYTPAIWLAAEQGGIVVRNVVFAHNEAPAGVLPILVTRYAPPPGGDVIFNNVTVIGADNLPGIHFDVEGSLSIANGIFWGSGAAELDIVQNTGTVALDHNDIGIANLSLNTSSLLDETDTLNVDPGFVAADSDDFRLRPDSPLRDAGNPAALGGIGLTDAAGMPRLAFGSVDIGAYEVPDDTLFRDGFEA